MTIAPMSGITDAAFRHMLLKYGRPDVFWTEFVSADGLFSRGKEKLLPYLKFIKAEHPIVAQIFGSNPDLFEKTASIIEKLGFDGIDINMGCPDRDIEKQGAGAALIKNPELARQIIRAVRRGAGKLPISVKTRIGYAKNEISEWIPVLLGENIAVLTVHLRTREERFNSPAHWESAKQIIKLRDRLAPGTLIFGNGDVKSLERARSLAIKTGLDGIMIGRGVLENPWFFSEKSPKTKERLNFVIEHAKVFEKLNKHNLDKKGNLKNFDSLKKYFKSYVAGFSGARDLRDHLMKTKSAVEVKTIIKDFLKP